MNSAAHKATKIEGSHDYLYRSVRVRVQPGQYRGQRGYYYVSDFILRDQFGRLNRPIQFTSLAYAKQYIDSNLDTAE